MKPRHEQSVSLWMATAQKPDEPSLREDLTVDVCIVGSGVAGLTCGYFLTQQGKSVAILESREIIAGQSQRTSAHLTNAHDDYYSEVEKVHGTEGMKVAAQAHTAAIDAIERIVQEEQIDCHFERLPGYLWVAGGESDKILDLELDAATRAGIEGLEIVDRSPLTGFDTGRCLVYPRQARFHPVLYLDKLAELITSRGGRIFTETPVKEVTGGDPAKVVTESGNTVTAQAVIVATNSPVNDLFALHTKMAPYLTYVIGGRIPKKSVPTALYWDTMDPYHYCRTEVIEGNPEEEILIVGGEDHKAGQVFDQTERHDRLEAWARERFPMLKAIEYRWSGMVMETIDGMAFIGKNPGDKPNVFVATGDSGMGLTHGTIAGLLLPALLRGENHPWAKYFDPSRTPVAGMSWKRFALENANVAKEYAIDWLGDGDYLSVDDLHCDQGTVVRVGLSRIAFYKDAHGCLHECSAVCSHLGGIVHWNDEEKVWDCPCHGSRFDAYGEVVQGPAISPLAETSGHLPSETHHAASS